MRFPSLSNTCDPRPARSLSASTSDRRVAVSSWRSATAAIRAVALLALGGTLLAGCDGGARSLPGVGGQPGGGTGGRTETGSGGQGAGGSGGSAGAGGGAGGASVAIWTSDATEAVVEDDGGGFVGSPPAGSACGYGVASYTFTVADGKLAWHVCNTTPATQGAPFTFVDGSRILNAGEVDMLVTALRAVVPSTSTICGADKSERLLTITRPSGTDVYLDDFYVCQHRGVYVSGIDGVFSVAHSLAE